MKRQLSLVLALVMILGSFSAVFAAEMPTTAVDKAAFLKSEGILKGNAKGELNLAQDLKRRDALVVLSRLFDKEDVAKAYPAEKLTFTDLTDPHYKGYVSWAVEEGYAKGKVEGVTFGLNDPLTAQQFSTTLLRALGYEENGTDIFKEAYKIATDLGVLEDVKVEQKDTVTRSDMAAMTFNALGVVVKGGTKTLAETLGITMPAPDKLTAEVKETENLKEVVLELSNAKLVDADKLENVNNYKVVDNKVLKTTIEGNNVIILLEKALLDGREYKLRVRSIDKAVNKEYKFTARDNTLPTIEEVVVLGEYGIKVITNEPIDIYEGTDRGRNFVVDGKNIAMNVESYGREIILTPYAKETFKDAKTLTVTALADFAGFKTGKESFDLEVVKDEVAPKVEDVILRGDKVVEVVFDKDVYVDSIDSYYDRSNVGNISYLSGRHTIFADKATKIDTNKVRYEFTEEFLRTRTDFTVVDVTNHSKVAMEKTTMVAREILDNVEPEIIEKKIDSKFNDKEATITLRFDKDVTGIMKKDSIVDKNKKEIEFEVSKHMGLYERDVLRRNDVSADHVVSVKYDMKDNEIVADTIVVELKDLKEWKTRNTDRDNYDQNEMDYVLEIERFASGRSEMYRDYYEFKFQQSSGFSVKQVKVDERRNETHITMEFTKKVDRVIAEDPTNYIFTKNNTAKTRQDVKDLKGRIVTERNGYEVTLILPDFKVADYATLRILDVLKDTGGKRLDREVTYDFETGLTDKEAGEIAKIDAKLAELVKTAEDAKYKDDAAVKAALVLAKEAKTPAEKEAAIAALEAAIKVIDEKGGIVAARVALDAAIEEADKIKGDTKEVILLKALVIEANELKANEKATLEEINAMVAKLVKATKEINDAANAAIEAVKLEKAQEAVLKAETSENQEDVNAAKGLVKELLDGKDKTALQEKLALVQAGIDEKAVVEAKKELQLVIVEAEELVKVTNTSDDATPGTVTEEVKEALTVAIKSAKEAHGLETTTVETINQAKTNLNGAVAVFNGKIAQ